MRRHIIVSRVARIVREACVVDGGDRRFHGDVVVIHLSLQDLQFTHTYSPNRTTEAIVSIRSIDRSKRVEMIADQKFFDVRSHYRDPSCVTTANVHTTIAWYQNESLSGSRIEGSAPNTTDT